MPPELPGDGERGAAAGERVEDEIAGVARHADDAFEDRFGHLAGVVDALLERGLDPHLPVMRAIGVQEIWEYIAEEIELEEAIASGQQATRNYAKRQYTWFAHQSPPEWPRFREPLDVDAALELLKTSA